MCTCFAQLYNAFILFWQLVLVARDHYLLARLALGRWSTGGSESFVE